MDVAALATVVRAGVIVADSASKKTLTVSCIYIVFMIAHLPTWKTQYVYRLVNTTLFLDGSVPIVIGYETISCNLASQNQNFGLHMCW
jgi:hypothetical protein